MQSCSIEAMQFDSNWLCLECLDLSIQYINCYLFYATSAFRYVLVLASFKSAFTYSDLITIFKMIGKVWRAMKSALELFCVIMVVCCACGCSFPSMTEADGFSASGPRSARGSLGLRRHASARYSPSSYSPMAQSYGYVGTSTYCGFLATYSANWAQFTIMSVVKVKET